jgi:hypothetical protein
MKQHTDVAPLITALDTRVNMLANVLRDLLDATTLECGTYTIPSSGVFEKSWHVGFHSVSVANLGAASLTVSSSPAGEAAPGGGPGVVTIPPSPARRTHNLAGNTLSVYGTAGTSFVLEVFARPMLPLGGQ